MPPNIRKVGESKYPKVFLYGDPGVGKTSFIGTGGPDQLILRPPTDHTDSIITQIKDPSKRPSEWIIKGWDEMDEALRYLRYEGKKWHWVWLDSVSLWQDTGLDDIWAATKVHNPKRNEKHAGIDKGEYGRNMDRLSEWVRHVVGVDAFNFGMTGHTYMGEFAGERIKMPWVQGKMMAEKFCGYCNIVVYMEVRRRESGEVYRVFRTQKTPEYYAKDQYSAFANGRLVDPTLPKFEEAVNKAKRAAGIAVGAVPGATRGPARGPRTARGPKGA